MTPKEKAKELLNKFIEFTRYWDELDGYMVDKYNAKQCALIAVDEILNSWYPVNIHCGYEFNHDNLTTSFYEYWEQVKNELKKI